MDKLERTVKLITRDLNDGLILMDRSGTVQYFNPSASRLLGNDSLKQGEKYAEFMDSDDAVSNDEFHQYVLDSIYDKSSTHSGNVKYTCPDGAVRYFRVSASTALDDDGKEPLGVIVQFSDITDLHKAKIKHDDATKVLIAIIAMMSVWNFVYVIWELAGRPITPSMMTVIIEVIGVIGTIFAIAFTSITISDFGLGVRNLKESVKYNTILTAVVLGVMLVAKFIIITFFPNVFGPGASLIFWDKAGTSSLTYIITVIVQEFLTRGAAQGSIEAILPEKYPQAFAIIISSLIFGALHVHRGIAFMVGATLLLSIFGFIYKKQGTIWGLCIPHYFLGLSLTLIWGIA